MTIPWTFSVPAWMTTPITARTRGSSYATSWPAALRPPISEYLLADAQPAMRMPITDMEETARARKMPVSMSMNQRSGPAGMTSTNRNVEISTTNGASLNTTRSAAAGIRSSFWRNFPTSARSCSDP